jgi:hypothetical protein
MNTTTKRLLRRAKLVGAGLLAIGLAGCAALLPVRTPVPEVATAPRAVVAVGGPVDFGAWRSASATAVRQQFSSHILQRWPTGAALTQASGELGQAGFVCAPPRAGAAESPDIACRREAKEGDCTHVWTVTLFDDAGAARLSRVRAFYDRRCGDGLAGGPD